MNIIIFLVILAILVLVHELGHFLIAKKNGVRVDEFGLGFPPKIFGKKFGETEYTLNLLPFGGFVKIYGENSEGLESESDVVVDKERSLVYKSNFVKIAVLSGGVLFNILFAWIAISAGLVVGIPMSVDPSSTEAGSSYLIVSTVVPSSPAESAGIKPGDTLISLKDDSGIISENINPESVKSFISKSNGDISVTYVRGGKTVSSIVTPKDGIVTGAKAIGISMDIIGTVKMPVYKAIYEGAMMTGRLFVTVSENILLFFKEAIFGKADLSQVAGPVGMVSLVGDAKELGFAYLLFFTVLLSINLAVINLMPLPALDGGRIVMVIIEAIKGSPIKPKIVQAINGLGFSLLIILMLIVTYSDIAKLFK